MTAAPLRVAFFTDSYNEANGVARTSQALESYAARRALPFLCVHAGSDTSFRELGSTARFELKRSPIGFPLEHDMTFDLLFWRHRGAVERRLRSFRPDVLHLTGPSDVGQLGAYLGHRLGIPMVGSWHTNLHEYASLRAARHLGWLPGPVLADLRSRIEHHALDAATRFYRIPQALLAPNQDIARSLARATRKPTYLMSRGVDTDLFTPSLRDRRDEALTIGLVGRLSPEKNVRLLADVEQAVIALGIEAYRFVIIGDGSEREWLERHLDKAAFPGILRGEALARAYANMDLFVFPSETDTVGNVVLEAMASGVPVVAIARGGPRFLVESGESGVLVADARDFAAATVALLSDRPRRERMGRAARDRALTLSWDRIFDQVYGVYARVCQ